MLFEPTHDEAEILTRFHRLAGTVSTKFRKLNEEDILYLRYFSGHNREGYSQMHPNDIATPDIFRVVMTWLSRVITDPRVNALKIFPAETSDAAKAEIINQCLNYQAAKGGLEAEMQMALTTLFLTGRCYGMVYWDEKYQKVYKWQETLTRSGKKKRTQVPSKVLIHSIPRFMAIKNNDMWFDTEAERFDEVKWVCRRCVYSIEWLKAQNEAAIASGEPPIYKNLDKLEDLVFNEDGTKMQIYTSYWGQWREFLFELGVNDTQGSLPFDRNCTVHEWWDFEEWTIKTIAYGMVVIRDTPIPYEHGFNPFIFAQSDRIPFSVFGLGIRPIEGIYRAINAFQNMQIEHMAKIANPPVVSSDARLKPADIKESFSKGFLQLTADGQKVQDKITFLNAGAPLNNQTMMLYNRELVESGIDRSMNAPRQAQGVQSSGEATATEIRANQIGIDSRTAMNLTSVQSQITSRISALFFHFDKQYLSEDLSFFDIQSGERKKLSFEDLQNFDIDFYTNPSWNWEKPSDPNSAIMLYQFCAADPTFNKIQLFENLAESFGYRRHKIEEMLSPAAAATIRTQQKQVALAEKQTDIQGIQAGIQSNPQVIQAQNLQNLVQAQGAAIPEVPPMPPLPPSPETQGAK